MNDLVLLNKTSIHRVLVNVLVCDAHIAVKIHTTEYCSKTKGGHLPFKIVPQHFLKNS